MNNKKIKILFLSAEIAPLAKVGGLGDVAGALPKELAKLETKIIMCLPFYGLIDKEKFKIVKIIDNLEFVANKRLEKINVWQTALPESEIPIYLIEHPIFASHDIYSGPRLLLEKRYTRHEDDLKRFTFYTLASLHIAKTLNFKPAIIHANDWHTALTGNIIKNWPDNFFAKTKTVFTIHNLANQGISNKSILKYADLDLKNPALKNDLLNKDVNFMVQGILNSDIVTTVSPNYAKEILTPYKGAGLDNILQLRKKDLYGIINGIDENYFNPQTDISIAQKYSKKDFHKKILNKIALQKKFNFKPNKEIIVIGLVSRFVEQKGINIIIEMIENNFRFLKNKCQFVLLGSGQTEYENKIKELAQKYPELIRAEIGFDENLAHLIYAGSDIFLMPSLFEPCGLGQLIAMRYGTIPLVRETGGLKDTVKKLETRNFNLLKNCLPPNGGKITHPRMGAKLKITATGFSFQKFESKKLFQSLKFAIEIFNHSPEVWQQLQKNGMRQDFSWKKSAKKYYNLYLKLIK